MNMLRNSNIFWKFVLNRIYQRNQIEKDDAILSKLCILKVYHYFT